MYIQYILTYVLRRDTQAYTHNHTHMYVHMHADTNICTIFPDRRSISYILLGVECSFPLEFYDCFCLCSKVFEISMPSSQPLSWKI